MSTQTIVQRLDQAKSAYFQAMDEYQSCKAYYANATGFDVTDQDVKTARENMDQKEQEWNQAKHDLAQAKMDEIEAQMLVDGMKQVEHRSTLQELKQIAITADCIITAGLGFVTASKEGVSHEMAIHEDEFCYTCRQRKNDPNPMVQVFADTQEALEKWREYLTEGAKLDELFSASLALEAGQEFSDYDEEPPSPTPRPERTPEVKAIMAPLLLESDD